MNILKKCLWAFLMLIATAQGLLAHDVGLSMATVHARADKIEAVLVFAVRDLDALAQLDSDQDTHVAQAEFDAKRKKLDRIFSEGFQISCDGVPVLPASIHYQLDGADNAEVQLTFDAGSYRSIQLSLPFLKSLQTGHRTFVTVLGAADEGLAERLADKDSPSIVVLVNSDAPKSSLAPHSFSSFVLLGIEHIGTGYDHLLFLFGLLLVTRNLKSSLLVITCFTIAHSITLGVATLNLVSLRSSITEPLIALSIVYVGVENLLTRGEPKGRWLLTFAFGLVHGFGFASVLRDLGVTASSGVALPLFSFNLGVEIGQITVAALLLPVIWRVRNHEIFIRRIAPACSIAIAAAGAFWFCQRVWG